MAKKLVNVQEQYEFVIENLEEVDTNLKAHSRDIKEGMVTLGARIQAVEQKLVVGSKHTPGGGVGGVLLSEIVGSEQMSALRDNRTKSIIIPNSASIRQLRAGIVGDDGDSNNNPYPGGYDRDDTRIHNDPRLKPRVYDLLHKINVRSSTFEYVQLDSLTNAADYQAQEGDLKAEQDASFDLQRTPVVTIAVTCVASEQVLDDNSVLGNFLENRLLYGVLEKLDRELIDGAGGSGAITGLLTQATSFVAESGSNSTDAIGEAIAELEITGWRAGAVIMHPHDWQRIRSNKTTDGAYVMGTPAQPIGPSVWNVPVVTSTSMSQGQAIVMDTNQASLLDRMTPSFAIDRINDQFARNMVTLRAELRAGLAVFSPTAVLSLAI